MALPTPLLEWGADEASGDALDSSGNGRSLAISTASGVSRVAGRNGSGLQQISAVVSEGPSLSGLQTANRSIALDLRVNAGGSFWLMEYKAGGLADGSGSFGLLLLSSTFRWRAKDASGTVKEITLPTDAGNWHHVVVTHDGATLKLYRDGALYGSIALAGAIQTADHFVPFDLAGSAATIDNVRIYDVALTPAQVAEVAVTPVGAHAPSEDHSATLALTGQGSLTLAASVGVGAGMGLAGNGSTVPSGKPEFAAAFDLAAEGSLMMDGMLAGLDASLSLGSSMTFGFDGTMSTEAIMLLTGQGTVELLGSPALAGDLALSSTGTLSIAEKAAMRDITVTASIEPPRLHAAIESRTIHASVEAQRLKGVVE